MARKCTIENISNKHYEDFLLFNHIDGYRSSQIKLGLFHNNKLVSVIGLTETKKDSWEIIRFANTRNTNVIGGLSKLLHYCEKQFNIKSIKSYVNARIYTGSSLEKIGFSKVKHTGLDYWYIDQSFTKRLDRRMFQKKLLIKKYNFPEEMTEFEMVRQLGYDIIYGCGSWLYVKE